MINLCFVREVMAEVLLKSGQNIESMGRPVQTASASRLFEPKAEMELISQSASL